MLNIKSTYIYKVFNDLSVYQLRTERDLKVFRYINEVDFLLALGLYNKEWRKFGYKCDRALVMVI